MAMLNNQMVYSHHVVVTNSNFIHATHGLLSLLLMPSDFPISVLHVVNKI